MNKDIKVKILDMTYNRDKNLFNMKIEYIDGDKDSITLVMPAEDFNVTNKMPMEVIDEFCGAMIGKEKFLHVQTMGSPVSSSDDCEEMMKAYNEIQSYPIDDIVDSLREDDGGVCSGG